MKKLTIMTMTVCLCASTALFAASGSWNLADAGDWETGANWVGNNIADGAGSVAYFTNIANGTINADTRTIGEIHTDAAAGFWLADGPITLDNGASTPVIESATAFVPIHLNCALAGSSGYNKTGAGWILQYNTTISGDINVNAGVLGLMWADAIKNADVKVNNGGTLYISDGIVANGKSVTVNTGGVLSPYIYTPTTAGLNAPLTCNDPYDGGNNNAVDVKDGTLNLNSNITLSANTMLDTSHNNAILNINGVISGNNNLILRGVNSSGTFNINTQAVYNGVTTFRTWNGTAGNPKLELNVNQAIPVGTEANRLEFIIDWGANSTLTLDMNATTQKVNHLFMGTGSQAGQSVEITGNDSSLFIITNKFTDSNGANDLSLRLTSGKLLVEADAAYTWIHKPIYVTNATMILNAPWYGSASTLVDVQSGGIVGGDDGGNQTYGALTIRNGGKVSPGDDEIGTLAAAGNVIMEAGSEYDWEYDASSADKIAANGTLTLPTADNSITVNVSRLADVSTTFILISSTGITGGGTDGVGAFVAEDPNDKVTGFTKDGNNINISVIPEPGAIGMLCLLGIAFLRRK